MKTVFRLLRFLKPFVKDVMLSVLAGIVTIASGIGMLGTSAFLISSAALHPSIADLQVAIVGVRFFGICRSVFRYLERVISHSVNLKVLAHIRVWFYEGIEPLAPAGLQNMRSGDLFNRIMSDLETLENFYVRVVSPLLVAVVITTGMSLILGSYFLELGLILLAGMAVNGLLLPGVSILLTRKRGEQLLRARSDLSASMLEMFQGLEDLQAAGAENKWLENIRKSDSEMAGLQTFNGMLTGINDGLILLVMNCTVIAVLIAAIPRVNVGTMTGVSLAVVIFLSMASFEATAPLPLAAQNLMASIAAEKRMFELVKQPPQSKNAEIRLQPNPIIKEIEIKDVSFSYSQGQQPVLNKVNLKLALGQKVAVVGPSGAGKTSLVNLLLGFWDFQAGQILFDGIDIHSFESEKLRHFFGVISQSSYIFSESLRNNLLLAKEDASDEDIFASLNQVGLLDWYKKLPEGLDTWLGERGVLMSGGERQRLSIARVLLQDTPFLILDEPTSNLDPETEAQVMKTLLFALKDRGLFLITHKLNLLNQMDNIYFLSGGVITEEGSERILLKKHGDYQRFSHLQNQIFT